MPRRFEFIGGNSAKFWEVTVAGKEVSVRVRPTGHQRPGPNQALPRPSGCRASCRQIDRPEDRQRLHRGGPCPDVTSRPTSSTATGCAACSDRATGFAFGRPRLRHQRWPRAAHVRAGRFHVSAVLRAGRVPLARSLSHWWRRHRHSLGRQIAPQPRRAEPSLPAVSDRRQAPRCVIATPGSSFSSLTKENPA